MLYPVPVVLALDSFDQKQASVFQVTRTPGRNVVYLGCILLIIGVFAMLYIRERRLWSWLQDDGQGGTRVRMALSARVRPSIPTTNLTSCGRRRWAPRMRRRLLLDLLGCPR